MTTARENDFALLTSTLDAVCEGAMLRARDETLALATLCREAGDARTHDKRDEAAARIASMDADALTAVLRYSTARFHLLNKAEQLNIARVNRDRERASTDGGARPESILDAVRDLKGLGVDRAALLDLLARVEITPTFTAHPTETRRRTILFK